MSEEIWKFEIETMTRNVVEMPIGAKILTVQLQLGTPCIWALVNPKAPLADRVIEVFGTGLPIEYATGVSREYIGTYQLMDGALVLHVFEYTGV